jgi:hypothetical protein
VPRKNTADPSLPYETQVENLKKHMERRRSSGTYSKQELLHHLDELERLEALASFE